MSSSQELILLHTSGHTKNLYKKFQNEIIQNRYCFVLTFLKMWYSQVAMKHWFFITTNTTIPEIIFCHLGLFPGIHQDYLGTDGKLYPPHSFILLLGEKPAVVHGQEGFRLRGNLLRIFTCRQHGWLKIIRHSPAYHKVVDSGRAWLRNIPGPQRGRSGVVSRKWVALPPCERLRGADWTGRLWLP